MDQPTVLITGCSSGIGRATAEQFLAEDWLVYVTARDLEDIEDFRSHENARLDTLEVTTSGDVERVVHRMIDETGRIDCLVNNAGYGQYGAVEDVPIDRTLRQLDVNVAGPQRLVQAVLPQMRERGEGTIVNVSSVQGRIAVPGAGVYGASKHALEAMSDSLRAEVADFGVDVVLVEPGPVDTGFRRRVYDEIDDHVDRTYHAYGWLYDLMEDYHDAGGAVGPLSVPPAEVATVIHDAAEVSDPDARYPVGLAAKLLIKSRYLPDSLRDRLVRLVRSLAT